MTGFGLGMLHAGEEQNFFDRARLALFDKKFEQALADLDRIVSGFPESNVYAPALFYKGKCLGEMKRLKEAVSNYEKFIKISENENLVEEAIVAIIDLNFALYEKGERKYILKIADFLENREPSVRYYAAIKLSFAKEKKIAQNAVPTLKEIIKENSDKTLVDWAKIALMRINPNYLKNTTNPRSFLNSILHIKVVDKNSKNESFAINIPFALAGLALDAIPEKEKKVIKSKGYDLDSILSALTEAGDIIKLDTDDSIIRIWIE